METEKNGPKSQQEAHLSHEKKPPTFHYTGSLVGILDPHNGL